jgi:hypothetical protein
MEVAKVIRASGWIDGKGDALPVVFANPRTKHDSESILWIIEPRREVRVLSVPEGVEAAAVVRAIEKGCERLGNLRRVKRTPSSVVTFEIYFRRDEPGWGVRRREKYFKQQKYRAAQKFSSAFKPKLVREIAVEMH